MANIEFYSRKADETQDSDFAPIPEGEYTMEVKAAEIKPTKAGDGEYINIQTVVLGPSFAGRVVFTIVNIKNKNETAEAIGLRQLKELRTACGIAVLRDTDELLGRCFIGKVKIQKSSEYGDKNTVTSFKSINGGGMPMQASAPIDVKTAAPPWAKK
jgi:hypothetical protein